MVTFRDKHNAQHDKKERQQQLNKDKKINSIRELELIGSYSIFFTMEKLHLLALTTVSYL